VDIHANGDVAIDIALRVYERLSPAHPRPNARFRIEHCTLINDDLLKRIKALDVIPTPFWTYVYYHAEKMKYYGPERLDHMFAMRTFLDCGIRVAPGSDYTPGPFEPMMALQSCVTRTDSTGNVWGPKQKITVAEAIRASSRNGAYADVCQTRRLMSFARAPLFGILFETAQYPGQTVANPYRRYCSESGEDQRSNSPQIRRE
jgi:predicted amidohydrolase YtcJ